MSKLSRKALSRKAAKQPRDAFGHFTPLFRPSLPPQPRDARGRFVTLPRIPARHARSWLGGHERRKLVYSISTRRAARKVFYAKSTDVIESYVESQVGSRKLDKRDKGAQYEKDRRRYRRTVFGKFATYTWEFDSLSDAQLLLVELNARYDSYRVPGTLQRVVCRLEIGYHSERPDSQTWVSSPYDWIADVNLYAHSWEEKSSSQVMLQSLDDRSKLRFVVELLLPWSAVEQFGEPD